MNIPLLLTIVLLTALFWYFFKRKKSSNWVTPTVEFPNKWRVVLIENISFYNSLSPKEKKRFEFKVQEFILNHKITGVKTTLTITDKLLVASSAVIPIFGFDNWKYVNLYEILIYPAAFNAHLKMEGNGRHILGMVGNGNMKGTMILSKEALRHGFKNETDKKNTAIHEFVHLIDRVGGTIDGIPSALMEKQYAIPWLDLINKKLEEIYEDASDINPYGGTNKAEFFSVASEYFFERPKLMQRKHPELYQSLQQIFNQDMASKNLTRKTGKTERNSPCPCNSGKKYKKCCGGS